MSTTTELNALDLGRVRSGSADLHNLANAYGVKLPAEQEKAQKVTTEARRVAREAGMAARLTLPAKPEKTADLISETAAQRVRDRERIAVANELADAAEFEVFRLTYSAIPTIFAAMSEAFDTARGEFVETAKTAPLDFSAHLSPEEVSAHQELLRIATRLTMTAAYRLRLAEINGENTRGQLTTWLVLDPKPEINLSEIRGALGIDTVSAVTWDKATKPVPEGGLPTDLTGWTQMVRLGCSLAHDGEAETRAQRFRDAAWHAGLGTPDGGMLDRTYGDALALVPAGRS
jgi:hypothetical protein